MLQKSYDGKPTLYLITTPIGNMEDITLRALKILNEVEIIFSEDTRETRKLLSYHKITKKLVSSHKFNEKKNEGLLLEYLKYGKNVGLVSDRGTPLISDPGYELVLSAVEHGYNVVAIPGVTAFVPALITSGIETQPFLFYGFLSAKNSELRKQLELLKNLSTTLIFYEAPHRLEKTINLISEILGNRKISISREITKKYEEIYRGKINDALIEMEIIKGEFVLIVEGNKEEQNFSNLTIVEHVNLYLKENIDLKEAIRKTSKDRNVSKNEIYKVYHGIKE